MNGRPHIVIIGGGISGLSALEHITRVAPALSVSLLEASPRLGGHIRTDVEDGFVMEAGPDVLLTSKPAAVELARRVGLGERLQGTNPHVRGSYILSDGRLRRVPDGMTGLVPSRFGPFVTTPVLSPLTKLRVGLEYFIPPSESETDESIEAFVTRRLGRGMYERLIEPLLSGISAGDGARLSMSAMFPHLRDYERKHGGLIRGMLAAKRNARPSTAGGRDVRSPFMSFPGGLQELVSGVIHAVRARNNQTARVDLRVSEPVHRVGRLPGDDARFEVMLASGERIVADAIVLATPAYAASTIVRDLDSALSTALGAIEYVSTATIALAYADADVSRQLDATGYVVPRRERRPILACTWTSAKFTGRAPAGNTLFRLFAGSANRLKPELLSDDQLLAIAREEMRQVLGITGAPRLVRINRFASALPQYNVGHRDRIAAINGAIAGIPRIELAGAVYRGIGIPDCVQSGIDAASRVVDEVRATSPSLARAVV